MKLVRSKREELLDQGAPKILTAEKEIDPLSIELLVKNYLNIRDKRQELDRASKDMKNIENQLEEQLWTEMESKGFRSVHLDGIGLVIRTFRSNAFVKDFPLFRRWCREQELMELIQETAKRQNLRDFIYAKFKESDPNAVPPGVDWITDKIIQIKGRERDEISQEGADA